MNEEQFETLMINSTIKVFLSENCAKELFRSYKDDINGDLLCEVVSKTINNEDLRFVVLKNEKGEYYATPEFG